MTFILCFYTWGSQDYRYTGIAYDINNQIIYKEVHHEILKDGKISGAATRYLDPKNQEIAFLINDFSRSLSFPEFYFKNHITQHEHGVAFENDQYQMYLLDKGEKQSKEYFPMEESVTGQGFHFRLVQKLPTLKMNEKGVFDFVIPGRLTSYEFIYEVKEKNNDFITIQITMKNLFLRLLAPSMLLRYDNKTLRLIEYQGLSNVFEKQMVKIIYQH